MELLRLRFGRVTLLMWVEKPDASLRGSAWHCARLQEDGREGVLGPATVHIWVKISQASNAPLLARAYL